MMNSSGGWSAGLQGARMVVSLHLARSVGRNAKNVALLPHVQHRAVVLPGAACKTRTRTQPTHTSSLEHDRHLRTQGA